jgi:hypothetical protein
VRERYGLGDRCEKDGEGVGGRRREGKKLGEEQPVEENGE